MDTQKRDKRYVEFAEKYRERILDMTEHVDFEFHTLVKFVFEKAYEVGASDGYSEATTRTSQDPQ